MAQVPGLATSLPRVSQRLCVTRFTPTRITHPASLSTNTLNNHQLSRSTPESPLFVFDAPSQPSEYHTRRSARSPHSLSDYYNARRRLARHAPRQVRCTTSTSTASTLNSVPHSENGSARIFDSPSRPREYYVRPQRKRDLPDLRSSLPLIALLTALGLSVWGAFILYATNLERVSSSVVRQLSSNLRTMVSVKDKLGEDVKLQGKWWLGGEPWIDGAINLLQGNVDVSFRIKGSKGAGTVYFTSVREEKGQPFTILRAKVICDDGTILRLLDA